MQSVLYKDIAPQLMETIQALEKKYDCYIFLMHERRKLYMSIIATNAFRCHEYYLAKMGDTEGACAAIEQYFIEVGANANIVS